MMSISQQQRIKLPSVNDIFPATQLPSSPPSASLSSLSSSSYTSKIHSPSPMTPIHRSGPVYRHPQHSAPVYYPVASPNMTCPMTPLEISPYTPRYYYAPATPVYAPASKFRAAKQTRQSNAWSYEDDLLLKHLKEVRNLGWREISCYFKNRTANGCQFRWRRLVALAKLNNKDEETEKESDQNVDTDSSRSNSLKRILN